MKQKLQRQIRAGIKKEKKKTTTKVLYTIHREKVSRFIVKDQNFQILLLKPLATGYSYLSLEKQS